MVKYPAILILLVCTLRLSGQLPNGSIAPDFNEPDINGQYRHLYEMLDQGKIVLLEVSATWCPPCWAYHNSHAMQNFYNLHGPLGDDKARVLFIEGDPETNVNCLYGQSGCNDYTPGNWVNGTTYPYLDNASIADAFEVAYYPTVYVICPNKKTYSLGQLSAEDLWEKARTCPVALGTNNAGIFEYQTGTLLHEVCQELELGPNFTMINLGANVLSAATIELQWNSGLVQTLDWTGSLPVYGEAQIVLNDLPISDAGILKTSITSVNYGAAEDDYSDNVINHNFMLAKNFDNLDVVLKIRTDDYGAETYWELRDGQGQVLDHGGNESVGPNGGGLLIGAPLGPGAYGNGVVIKDTLHLPEPGCYSIHFVDAYGDGMCCNFGNGYYKLYNINNPAVPVISGGEFEAYEHRSFGAQAVTATFAPVQSPQIELFPNPASGEITVRFNLPESAPVSASLLNAMGQIVYYIAPATLSAGEQQWQIPLLHLAPGLYVLQTCVGNELISKRFVHH